MVHSGRDHKRVKVRAPRLTCRLREPAWRQPTLLRLPAIIDDAPVPSAATVCAGNDADGGPQVWRVCADAKEAARAKEEPAEEQEAVVCTGPVLLATARLALDDAHAHVRRDIARQRGARGRVRGSDVDRPRVLRDGESRRHARCAAVWTVTRYSPAPADRKADARGARPGRAAPLDLAFHIG